MSRGLNKVMIIGRLGRDPEMRYTPQGSAVTNFSVATGGKWTDRDGNERDDTEWFRVVAWDRLAETCNQYLTKGKEVYIEGRLKTRKYTDKEGMERSITELVANNMVMLGSKGDSGYYGGDEGEPAAERSGGAPRDGGHNQPRPIDDDEIPF